MNVFLKELKAHRRSLIFWCIGVFLMVAAGMGKYAGMAAGGQSMNDLISKMPKAIQSIIGAGVYDLSTASGFYGVLYLYLALMAAVHASILGAGVLSREEQDKTAEFLFAKPASRSRIVIFKLLAAFVNIIVFNGVTLLSSLAIVGKYSHGEAVSDDILKLMGGMFILQLIYLLTGTGISAVSRNPRAASSIATGILLATFLLSMGIDINNKLEGLKYFTPFKYFDAKTLIHGGSFGTGYLVLSALLLAGLLFITWNFYRNRDLQV